MKIARVQGYRNRQSLVKICFIAIVIIFIYRAFSVTDIKANDIPLKAKASKNSEFSLVEKSIRGNILDRNNNLLAINLIHKKINLDPMIIQEEYIDLLADALEMPRMDFREQIIEKKINKRKYFIVKEKLKVNDPILKNIAELQKKRSKVCFKTSKNPTVTLIDKAKKIIGMKPTAKEMIEVNKCARQRIAGVAIESGGFRYYPKKDSIAPLIGKTNSENIGVFGIESEYDQYLAGINGVKRLADNKDNSNIYYDAEMIKKFKQGEDLKLTIDSDIQFHVFNAIKEQAEFHEADSAAAIVLSPNGEILALANYPSTNPNNHQSYSADDYRNRVFSDKTEPGSTMKPFTMLLALDKGVITATDDELIDVKNRVGNILPDKKYFEMTIQQILEKSHNLGTVMVAENIENEEFYDTWEKLGFGRSLGVMPGTENSGVLRHFSNWGLADKRSLSFGHGPMNTNLAQLARAYLVFANDGALPSLKLLKDENKNENITQVFTPESTQRISQILDSVASDNGSGYRAVIDGYSVAGKTGTAEMVIDGQYNKEGAKRTYFVGYSPADKPKYIMAVRLDYPKKCFVSWDPTMRNRCEGSNSASMAFKKAMERILINDPEVISLIEG
ncbi:penicillin-binding protein 2 [Candidatus Pseudothioglobus singularis]|nr:penicillin-binding protein 2 [Candidatus Pseudothioglobus singularis]MDA8854840.1 penicillin-binding protein 2 [Candidatus Pseudothioglobus singularis]MDC0597021.1 penicillin-binding protein 2 [Candidatus Pseudothioglobus singularis]